MKKIIYIISVLMLSILFYSCECDCADSASDSDSVIAEQVRHPNTKTFYKADIDLNEAIIVADTIIYDVIVINPDPNDEWTEKCLKDVDIQAIANIIFHAVYNKRLIPYHYYSNETIPVDSIKKIEKEFNREKIGKIQFQEKWYFDEENFNLYKKVNSIILGYELRNDNGEVRGYKAAFKVYPDSLLN